MMKTPIEQQIREYYEKDFVNFSSNLLIRIKATHIIVIFMLLVNVIFFTQEIVSIIIQLLIAVLVGFHDYDDNNLKKALTKNTMEAIKLTEVASKDYLTQIPNRRFFFQMGEKAFHLTIKDKTDCTVLFMDIDFFKKINDDLGHDVGDNILKIVASVLKKSLSTKDILARMGGEEFAIILPNTGIERGLLISENIRRTVEKTAYKHEGDDIFVTISIGLSQREESDSTLKDILKRADFALYKAKESGRNKTVSEALDYPNT